MKRLLAPVPLAAVAAVVALLALLVYGVVQSGDDTSLDDAVASGKRPRAAALELPKLGGGGDLSLASFKGKVVVLNFWASWCEPCKQESPLLQRWHRRITPRGGVVLGVDIRDLTSDAQAFVRRYGLTYPNVRDRGGDHLKDFGVIAYPDTLMIDRRGRIAATFRQPVVERDFDEKLAPLLEERS